jgi:hypothetical protein
VDVSTGVCALQATSVMAIKPARRAARSFLSIILFLSLHGFFRETRQIQFSKSCEQISMQAYLITLTGKNQVKVESFFLKRHFTRPYSTFCRMPPRPRAALPTFLRIAIFSRANAGNPQKTRLCAGPAFFVPFEGKPCFRVD